MITIRILDNASPELLKKAEKLSDLSPCFSKIEEYQLRSTKENFMGEHNPDGGGWAALKPSTIKQRGSAHPILRRTGATFASTTSGSSATMAWVAIGTGYAQYPQWGTSKMVQRQMLGIGGKDITAITTIFTEYISSL